MTFLTLSTHKKALLWLVQFVLLMGLLVTNQLTKPLKLNADIRSLFSAAEQDQLSKITDQIEQQATRSQIVLVGATSLDKAINKADELAEQLSKLVGVAAVKSRYENLPQLNDIIAQQLPYHAQLLTNSMRNLLEHGNNEDIFAYQFALLNQMGNQAVALTIAQEPRLTLADFFTRSMLVSSGLTQQGKHLVGQYQGKHYVLLTFSTQSSGINIDLSQALVSQFQSLITDDSVEYLYSGAIFYASKASKTGQFEMMFYGGISLIATLLLIALVYRNITAIAVTLLLIGISFVYGYLALSVFYDEISVIALVFSVTLIGIAADYSFHALTELKFAITTDTSKPLATITSSLLMSFLTTGAGYALLFLAPFILFKQIALFTLVGLFGALITVLLLYPLLQPLLKATKPMGKDSSKALLPKSRTPKFVNVIHSWQQRLVSIIARFKIVFAVVFILIISLTSVLTFNDDIRNYYAADKQLTQHENKIKAILKQKWDLQYFLVKGNNAQQVLVREEQLIKQLEPLIAQQALTSFSAISTWLPSIEQQKKNKRLLEQSQQQGKFKPLQTLLAQSDWQIPVDFNPLLPQAWFAGYLGKMYQSQWLTFDDHHYTIVRLSGIKNTAALQQVTDSFKAGKEFDSSSSAVFFIDKAKVISDQMALFSQQLLWVVLAALVAALLVFTWRYGIKVAMTGLLTPMFALLLALLISFALQGYLNIFNVVAGVLILALGLDYSVFYAEHGLERKITLTTLMSALSSIFVFAILMLSSMPAISSFGLTVFIGVTVTFIIAPIVTLAHKIA